MIIREAGMYVYNFPFDVVLKDVSVNYNEIVLPFFEESFKESEFNFDEQEFCEYCKYSVSSEGDIWLSQDTFDEKDGEEGSCLLTGDDARRFLQSVKKSVEEEMEKTKKLHELLNNL